MNTFILKETFRLLRRARLYFFFSVVSATLGLFLIQASLISSHYVNSLKKSVSGNVMVEIFLSDSLDAANQLNLENKIKMSPLIRSWKYVSKAEAESVFVQSTGENFRKILPYNPLPAAYQLTLPGNEQEVARVDSLLRVIKSNSGVTDIAFEKELYKSILYFSEKVRRYLFIAAAVLIALAVYVSISMSLFMIENSADEIRTMRLVGGSEMNVRMPVLSGAFLAGAISAIISICCWYILQEQFSQFIFGEKTDIVAQNSQILFYSTAGALAGTILTSITSFRRLNRIN